MINFKIDDKEYKVPESWDEVVLRELIQFISFYEDKAPEDLKKYESFEDQAEAEAYLLEEVDALSLAHDWPLWYAQEFQFWATDEEDEPIPEGLILGADSEDVLRLRSIMRGFINRYEPNEIKSFILRGSEYKLPNKLFSGATLIEYVEAVQFEHHYEQLGKSNWEALAPIMCIICRKPGEQYDAKLIDDRKELFLDCPMSIVIDVAFFLARQKLTLQKVFLMHLSTLEKVRRAGPQKISLKDTVGTE